MGLRGHQFLAVDIAGTLIAYSAAKHAVATMPLPAAYDLESEDAVGELRRYVSSGLTFDSFAARHGHFTSSPAQEPRATFDTVTGGSLIARRQLTGVHAGRIVVYDERGDRYPKPFQPGGAATLAAGQNVLLAMLDAKPHTVSGYSVARADWQASPSTATGMPLVAPQVEDNVGYFVDSADRLWAFGGDGDVHAFYSFPNDTEYQTLGFVKDQLTVQPSPLGMAFAGAPGDLAYLLPAFGIQVPGAMVGGFQNPLCLDPGTLSLIGPFGAIGASRVLPAITASATVAAPACVQLWLQELLIGGPSGNWLGQRCDALWFF